MKIKCVLLFVLPLISSAMSVTVVPSAVSPAPLGTVVEFQVSVEGTDSVNLTYRFRTRSAGPQGPHHQYRTVMPGYSVILLQSIINANPTATDLAGNLLWYGPSGLSLLTRMRRGGTFLGIHEDGTKDPSYQTVREFDLAGVTIAETNAQRVSDQLVAKGLRPITSFHHEAIRLPDGRFLLLAGSEQIMNNVQRQGSIDILGDTIILLNGNLQVVLLPGGHSFPASPVRMRVLSMG